jgi:NhaP-type Na+/H+ or K+/H+ antiporter
LAFKLFRKTLPLSAGEEKMLWYSGLMRGVIAFALSLQIESANRSYIITIALIVVMSTTVVGASLLKPFARKVGLSEL